tara:strand:+ start:426 stop:869 length:444 start_codon:yes stop_codon:yes gene_type:complete
MASPAFKREITKRFAAVVKYLLISETVKSKTEIGSLIGQPLQVVSKLLTGHRIITLEQTSKLIENTAVDSHWFLTGKGKMLRETGSVVHESQTDYTSNQNSSKAVAAILPLVTELEEKIGKLKKENDQVKSQLNDLVKAISESDSPQ